MINLSKVRKAPRKAAARGCAPHRLTKRLTCGLLLLPLRRQLLHTRQQCCSRVSGAHDVPAAAGVHFVCGRHAVAEAVAVFTRRIQRVSADVRRAAAAYADASQRLEEARTHAR